MIEVSYPPGAQDMAHRHNAHAFVYVLEGQTVMQLKGTPGLTLKAGQTYSEGPYHKPFVVGLGAGAIGLFLPRLPSRPRSIAQPA